jgi:hypothetical protein
MAPGEWLGIAQGLGKMTVELTDDYLGMIREAGRGLDGPGV